MCTCRLTRKSEKAFKIGKQHYNPGVKFTLHRRQQGDGWVRCESTDKSRVADSHVHRYAREVGFLSPGVNSDDEIGICEEAFNIAHSTGQNQKHVTHQGERQFPFPTKTNNPRSHLFIFSIARNLRALRARHKINKLHLLQFFDEAAGRCTL